MIANKHVSRIRFKSVFILLAIALLNAGAFYQASELLADDDHNRKLQAVAQKYDIEIVTTKADESRSNRFGEIECKTAEASAIEKYVPLFVDEFQLYPKALVKNANVKRVVLCTELSYSGQRRNAIPDWNNNTLYLEVVRGSGNAKYLRRVIHHEFFHMVDYWDDKHVYKDTDWAALNPAKFEYGTGGKNAQNNRSTGVLTEKYPGFLNHYSTTGVEEDKAEVFAHMIIAPDYMKKRTKENSVLRAKSARMRRLLEDFCSEVDAEFWSRVEAKKRKE